MKKLGILLALGAVLTAGYAEARNERIKFSIQDLLDQQKAKDALLGVPLYFAEVPEGVTETFGEITTSRKTNAFLKSDRNACEWAMLSALKVLQQRAIKEGMDAVVDIRSNYKHKELKSKEMFECGAGAVVAGVALKGTLVKLKS